MGKYHKTNYAKSYQPSGIARFFALLPILLTVGLMPFIVRLHPYQTQMTEFAWYYMGEDDSFVDLFLYYRQWWFTAISVYMFVVLLFRAFFDRKKLQYSIICIPLGVFALFSFLSACFSKYPHFAFGGSFEQFENVFVLMGYATIVYYSLIVIQSEQEVRYILNTLTASTLLLALIGAGQTLGYNILATRFFHALVIPRGIDATLGTTVSETTAYMTLYNPNYVGVYVATLLPLFVILLIFGKTIWERIAYALTAVLLLFTLYGSGSKAAFLVIAFEVLVFLLFLRKPILRLWYLIIPAATAGVCIFLLVNQWYDNAYISRIVSALQPQKTTYTLESIDTLDDAVRICYDNQELFLMYYQADSETIIVNAFDGNGEQLGINYSSERNAYVIDREPFDRFNLTLAYYDEYLCLTATIDGHDWVFTNQYAEDYSYYYLTTKGKFDKIVTAEQVLFSDYEGLFSSRGYIWSVTIPLLKEHIFLGSGADTFVISFPQQDYVRLWRRGFAEQLMSKPHCLYLQVGVQDGVIAMLGLIAFFAIYLINSLKLYINTNFNTYYEQVGVAVMLSVIGFAIMGISNDSSVTVSPIFWAIAGLGVYLNHKTSELKKAEKSAQGNTQSKA